MLNLENFLRGHSRVLVEAPFPQRLLNLAAQEGLLFWGLDWQDANHLYLTIPSQNKKRFAQLAGKIGASVAVESGHGMPVLWSRLRKRVGFLLGFAMSLTTVLLLSQFVLVIEITGNQRVATADIQNALAKAGVSPGVYGPSLSLSQLPQVVMADLEGIAWMGINRYGTRIEVSLRETVPPPEIYQREGLFDVVSTASGIIEEIQAFQGEKMVEVGDTVTQGQVLLSGNVELPPPLYSENPSQWLEVPASGKVIARTWRQITAVIPQTVAVKETYGVAEHSFTLSFFGNHWTFFDHRVIFPENYGKIKTSHSITGLEQWPLTFSQESQSPYKTTETPLNRSASRDLLEEALLQELQRRIGHTGEILGTEFTAVEKDGLLQVTILGECREEIGQVKEGVLRHTTPPEEE